MAEKRRKLLDFIVILLLSGDNLTVMCDRIHSVKS